MIRSKIDNKPEQLTLIEENTWLDQETELSLLIDEWQHATDQAVRQKLKQVIIKLIEIKERQSFLARYILRDFKTWNSLLNENEADVSKAHKADFYEPHLIVVLFEHDGRLPAFKAISKTLDRVKSDLSLADYKMTVSKRFRYDTTIRFLATSLKKRGLLSTDTQHKNKEWVLSEQGYAYARDLIKKRVENSVEKKVSM